MEGGEEDRRGGEEREGWAERERERGGEWGGLQGGGWIGRKRGQKGMTEKEIESYTSRGKTHAGAR